MKHRVVAGCDRLARLLPARHRLGFRFAVRRALRDLEKEIVALDRIAGSGRTAVDVGANEGWFSLPLARRFRRVIAIEPNVDLLGDLRAAAPRHLEVLPIGLSNRTGSATLYIPERNGLRLTGWATLDQENLPCCDRGEEVRVEVRTLDSLDLSEVDFLKIDVEGHEVKVLKGGEETIRSWRPRVLTEIRENHLEAVDRLLSSCGLVRDRRSSATVNVSAGNYLYVPAD